VTVLGAFIAGAIAGWSLFHLAAKFGMRVISRDSKALEQLLDGLGYSALLKMRDGVDAEIAKRKGSA
jgi:hypothetical protein